MPKGALIQQFLKEAQNTPWVTHQELLEFNEQYKQEKKRLQRIPVSYKTSEEALRFQEINALKELELLAFAEPTSQPMHFYELFLKCDALDEAYRMSAWSEYLQVLHLAEYEPNYLGILHHMGIMCGSPLQFAGYLNYLLTHNFSIDAIINSGLCHHFAQINDVETTMHCYQILKQHSPSSELIADFLEKLACTSIYTSDLSQRIIYPQRTLIGQDANNPVRENVRIPGFSYIKNRFEHYAQHFGLDFVVCALLIEDQSPELQRYIHNMDKNKVLALHKYSVSTEQRVRFYSVLFKLLLPEQKDALFNQMDKWLFCASLPENERAQLSDIKRQELLATSIDSTNFLHASVVFSSNWLGDDNAALCAPLFKQFIHASIAFLEESNEQSIKHTLVRLRSYPEIADLCREQATIWQQEFERCVNEAHGMLTQEVFYTLSDHYRNFSSQLKWLKHLSAFDVHLPKDNYEFYAAILYALYQKNPEMDLQHNASLLYHLVNPLVEKTDEIAVTRILYEALVYVSDESFQNALIKKLPSDWSTHFIAGIDSVIKRAFLNDNVSFFRIYSNKYDEAILLCFQWLNDTLGKNGFSFALAHNMEILKYCFAPGTESVLREFILQTPFLLQIADNFLLLETVLKIVPEAYLLEAVTIQNNYNNTVLSRAATIAPKSLKMILELLSKESRLKAVSAQNKFGNTILHVSAPFPESLKIVLDLLSQVQRFEALSVQDEEGNTVLHKVEKNSKLLKMILESLSSEEQRVALVSVKNKKGDTVLHLAAQSFDSLKAILKLLPKGQILNTLKIKNNVGRPVLDVIITAGKIIKMILELLPEKTPFEEIKVQDEDDYTVLYWLVDSPELLKRILAPLSKEQILEVLLIQDKKGYTVLHWAVMLPKSLKTLMELVPEKEILKLMSVKNKDNKMVLDLMKDVPESLKTILELVLVGDYDAVLSAYLSNADKSNVKMIQSITHALLGDSLPGFKKNDRESLEKGFKYALSFSKAIKGEYDSLKIIKKLLLDYTSNNLMNSRFFSDKQPDIQHMIQDIHQCTINNVSEVFKVFKAVGNTNSSDKMAYLIAFIEKNVPFPDAIDLEHQSSHTP